MRRSLFVPCAAVAAASFVSLANAAVTVTNVAASVTLSGAGGSVDYTASINRQAGIADIGTLMGQYGANPAIRGRWSAQLVGGAGGGANGGNVYAITVEIGSIRQIGPFAQTYTQAVLLPTDQIGGAAITNAAIGFGAGGEFGRHTAIADNSGFYGDAAYSMRTDPNFAGLGVTADPSLMSTYATVAADGSVGFVTSFNVASLFAGAADVGSLFNGNLTEYEVRGFNSSFFVEVVAVPAPGAVALFGLVGLAGRRRRR